MEPLLTLAISHFGEVLYLCGMTQASLSVTLRQSDGPPEVSAGCGETTASMFPVPYYSI